MIPCSIPIETSDQFSLVLAPQAGNGHVLTLRNDSDDPRSPLFHALHRNLVFEIQEPAGDLVEVRLPADQASVTIGECKQVQVRLGADHSLTLARVEPGDAGPTFTALHVLSPIEARFLADNGYPHPVPERRGAPVVLATDLHTHFAGCIEPDDLVRIGIEHGVSYDRDRLERAGIRIAGDGPVALAEMPAPALIKLKRCLAAPIDHQITYSGMKQIYHYRRPITKHAGAFIRLCEQIACDYQAMGVTLAELSLYDIGEARRLREVHEHLPGIESRTGVRLRFLAAMSRHDDLEWDLDYIDRIKELGRSRYLAGVDFMGRETNSTHAFVTQIVEVARWADRHRPGFVIRVHAGENPAHPENVRVAAEAVEGQRVQLRIGHGLYGVDERTLSALRGVGAIVEFNLNSNFALNNIQMTGDAPLWKYLEAGVGVVLATDGYGIYRTTLPLEARSAELAGMTDEQLAAIRRTEDVYIAERHAHEERHTLPPDQFRTPENRASKHFTQAVSDARAETIARRDRALRARLEEVGVELLQGDEVWKLLNHRRCLAFAGAWRKSWQRISTAGRSQVRAIVAELLAALEAEDTVLITGGTHHGVEGVVHEIAKPRGFPILGVIVDETPRDAIETGQITHAHIVSETLYDKAAGLYRLLQECNGTALFIGGGNIVSDEIQTARNLQVRHLLMDGVEGASAHHARHQPQLAFRSAAEVLATLNSPTWGSHEGRYYHPGANPTVDALVVREAGDGVGREVLLIRRADTAVTEAGKWALPGGFQLGAAPPGSPWCPGRESPLDACVRELQEETHLDLTPYRDAFVHVGDFEGGGRDPRDSAESWSKSQVFAIALPVELSNATIVGSDDAVDARWFDLEMLPTLAFDHAAIIAIGRKRLANAPS